MAESRPDMTPGDDPPRPVDAVHLLSDFGWIIEPTDSGGVRMRTSGIVRRFVLGCSVGLLLLFSFFGWLMYSVAGGMGTFLWGVLGLVVTVILLHILWLLFGREEWEAGKNFLEIDRRFLAFRWGNKYLDGELILEPNYRWAREDTHEGSMLYREGDSRAFWRLAVKSGGEKNYLIQESAISDRGAGIGFESRREEVEAIAHLLAQHTGWPVISAQREALEAARSATDHGELPGLLQARGFRVGVDERLRPTILRSKWGQIVAGIVLAVLGGGGLAFLVGTVQSEDLLTWLFVTPMLIVGVGVFLLGIALVFARERWIVDGNLFVFQSRLFGWKSEHQYVDGILNVAYVCEPIRNSTRKRWTWELQVQSQTGRVLKVLHRDRDDDVPRQLGAVLSQHTGWPCDSSTS